VTPEPLTTAIAATAGKAVAEKGVREATKVAAKLTEVLVGEVKVLNQEITVHCPEQVEELSIAFQAKPGLIGRKMRFPFGAPRRVKLRPVTALVESAAEFITMTTRGFEINTNHMSEGELYILDAEYDLDTPGFVDSLVQRNSAREYPRDHETEYWMHAELKHPDVLRSAYGRLDLRDLDFNVDVGISEHIKTVVPPGFLYELRTGLELLAERNPHAKAKLGVKHALAMKNRGKGDTMELLSNLQHLFFPSTFSDFLEVKKDFRYSECFRGTSFYDALPIPTWPRTMKVTARTDLSLDACAADGTLVYKRDDFLNSVKRILGIK